MDRLSDLPLNIIETILCRVPIQEAGRTSILSKEWRYRWTKVPKLVFDEFRFQVSTVDGAESSILEQKNLGPNKRQKMDKKSKLIYAVGQVLLMHDGPIHEFTLTLARSRQRVKIDHILTHLSRKTSIKKLNLNFNYAGYRLPSSNFSFHQLTDLCLCNCGFDHQATFNRFGSLTSLSLQNVEMSTRTLQRLLSSCPLLKTVRLVLYSSYISRSNDGPTFTELLECLPVIETLYIWSELTDVFEDSAEGRVPRQLPTPLFHLRYLYIHVPFTRRGELILALLIKSSPNLEKLKIFDDELVDETFMESSSRVNCYQGIMLEHLNKLEILDFVNHKTRLDFVKLILAKSPVLKKVRIFLNNDCSTSYRVAYTKSSTTNGCNSRNTRLNAAGLADYEPDLNEDPVDRWDNTGISDVCFEYLRFDNFIQFDFESRFRLSLFHFHSNLLE
ncbi:F-box/FBD/LRR-repeat protein-like protein [Tanacetum coccineum]